MFSNRAFSSYLLIVLGATVFGALFTTLSLLSNALFDETASSTMQSASFGITAFVGYCIVALLVRQRPEEDESI